MKTSNIQTSHNHAIIRGWVDGTDAGTDSGGGGGGNVGEYENASGGDLPEGTVVVLDLDGTITPTTTAQDTRPVGVLVDDIDDGDFGPVAFYGPVDLINVTASVTAGHWAETSTSAGDAQSNGSTTPREGSFAYFTSAGTTPSAYLTGFGAAAGAIPPGGLPWFNVRDYGAVGDGTTDDTTAFNDAIDALNAAGAGVLYVPASDAAYKVTASLNDFTVPATLMGDGIEALSSGAGPISLVTCTSATAEVFHWTVAPVVAHDIAVRCTHATPTAGGAFVIDDGTQALISRVQLRSFFTAIDIEDGARWMMSDVNIVHFEKYGVRIRNSTDPDDGDWSISGCHIISNSAVMTGDSCIRVESAGGGKIVNTKLGGNGAGRGIDVVVGTGVATSILEVTNVSIENITGNALHVETTGSGTYSQIQVSNCQFGLHSNTTGKAINITAASLGQIELVTIDDVICVSAANSNAAVALTNIDQAVIGTVLQEGFGSRLSTSGCTSIWDDTKPFSNYPVAVVPTGLPLADNATAGAAVTNGTAQRAGAAPIVIPGPMFVRALHIHVTVAGSGSIQWGLFDTITSRTAATKLCGGSAAPGGTGFREIAAASAPVLVPPGQYILVVMNPTSNASTFSMSTLTGGGTGTGFWKGVAGYTWDDTPDFTTGFSKTSIMYQCYLEGDMDRSGNRW